MKRTQGHGQPLLFEILFLGRRQATVLNPSLPACGTKEEGKRAELRMVGVDIYQLRSNKSATFSHSVSANDGSLSDNASRSSTIRFSYRAISKINSPTP